MSHLHGDDVLILTDRDLLYQTCCVKTKRGSLCKNKIYNGGKYCKLHHKQFSLEKPEDCPICMESLHNVDRPTHCGHWIHKDCLMKWKEDTCPMCRAPIKFTAEEKRIKRRIHKKTESIDNDVILPPQILELIESLLRGVPEYMREEFVAGFLHVDVGGNSIILGDDVDVHEDFSISDIEDFPDISEI
ncbi:MAG: RING finger domain-containing protein [Candidatus Colwellbacteria bacterium]|nr:RING finger domain-containing protein [Candidatus Colwellbacteria bacterium]